MCLSGATFLSVGYCFIEMVAAKKEATEQRVPIG
jgi:hypothetical protein